MSLSVILGEINLKKKQQKIHNDISFVLNSSFFFFALSLKMSWIQFQVNNLKSYDQCEKEIVQSIPKL